MLFDGVSHQLPDADPVETSEWLDAFDDIVDVHGRTRARYLLMRILERAGQKLVEWIATSYRPGSPLDIIIVCTGNSRRSILGAVWGYIAAAYYGMPEIRFHSGGTAPTAFNIRAVNTLKNIGVEIEETLDAMNDLVKQGKVRYPASSNYAAWQVAHMISLAEKNGYKGPGAPLTSGLATEACDEQHLIVGRNGPEASKP